MKEHTILNEKYRPDNLDGFLCTPKLKEKIEEFLKKQDIPHLGFFGQTGSGKTTLAKIIAKNIDCEYIVINATEDRSIETIKEKVGKFASSASFKPLKVVILDEATHILLASQVLLLNMIEQYSLKTRFILTGNFPERLTPPLAGRLQKFIFSPPTKTQIAEHISEILDKEKIKYNVKDIACIVNNNYPDIRSIINSCQKFTINNKLVVNESEAKKNDYIHLIIDELKKPSKKSFNIIRQIIVDNASANFEDVYKQLYNVLSEYAPGNEGVITVIIEEYLFHANFRIDQEISLMACINRILEVLT
jgi:replication factor C small subunit